MKQNDDSPVIFKTIPPPIPTTARDIGMELACDSADKQAAMLIEWSREVAKYDPAVESRSMQCRAIATEMTDEQCREVASLLYTLMEHLEAIPQERRAAKITGKVVGLVKSCDSMSDNIEYLDETIRKINRDQSAQNRDDKRSIRKIIDKIRVSVGLVNQDIGDTFKSLQDKTQRFGNEHDPHVVIFNKLELEIMLFALCQMEVEYGEPA